MFAHYLIEVAGVIDPEVIVSTLLERNELPPLTLAGAATAKLKPSHFYIWGKEGVKSELEAVPYKGDPLVAYQAMEFDAFTPRVTLATDRTGKPFKVISPRGKAVDYVAPEAAAEQVQKVAARKAEPKLVPKSGEKPVPPPPPVPAKPSKAADLVKAGAADLVKSGGEEEKLRGRLRLRIGPAPEQEDQDFMISQRNPTAVTAEEDPLGANLSIGAADVPNKPDVIKALQKYPNFRTKGVNVLAEFHQQSVDNLLWLHDQVPEAVRERSKLWYVGGRKLTERFSKEYEQPREAVAATIAALSPATDWFTNIELAKRLMSTRKEIMGKTFGRAERDLLSEWSGYKRGVVALVDDAVGKSYDELDSEQKALWIRAVDARKGRRGASIMSPEGEEMGPVRNLGKDGEEGEPSKISFGMAQPMARAINILDSPSRETISQTLGMAHKVRSFYNNLLLPSDPSSVTIDTHAVAAALLRPFSNDDGPVKQNFGMGSGKSKLTGVTGYYGLYADAYRDAAKQRGLLPREMQSITWEAVRCLFTEKFKSARNNTINKDAVDAVWQRYKVGKITIDETRRKILALTGGIESPSWVLSDSGQHDPAQPAANPGDIPRSPVRRPGARETGGRGRARAAPAVPVRGARDAGRRAVRSAGPVRAESESVIESYAQQLIEAVE